MAEDKKLPYSPKEIEQHIYKYWEDLDIFKGSDHPGKKIFSMVMPPPNITGVLHLGHALDLTLPDIIARFKRMNGYEVCWIPGTDQAGIATHNVVERELEKEGIKKEDVGRDAFIKKVWEWRKKSGNRIIEQIKLLGICADWSRERFTKDEKYEIAVRHAFVTYYNEGLIYRGKRMVNYCPRCKTALSDIEVDYIEEKSELVYIRYPIENTNQYIVVATTRPETMLGDTAVVVHPEDNRYKAFLNKFIILPLQNRRIPIITDAVVDIEFGTGAVKVTPAHDPADFDIGKRHNLPVISVIENGQTMNHEAGFYEGLSLDKARKAIIADLTKLDLIEKIEPYTHSVGHCSRCNKTIEPIISDQWYLHTKPLAEKALEKVLIGEIEFIPDRWVKVYRNWMEHIEDWCISRQIWWGIQIPVWYCECGEMIVSEKAPEKCPKCKNKNIVQDSDVLDTWFGSALWPFAVMDWPHTNNDFKNYYPTSLLVTAYDIIFFWVSRMIFSSVHFLKQVPFKKVFFHGLIRDKLGRKMSKSLNNSIDPALVIDEFGADALRFTIASISTSSGQDTNLDITKVASSRNFMNKIWNAGKFVLNNSTPSEKNEIINQNDIVSIWDGWLLTKFNQSIQMITKYLEDYRFNESSQKAYSFIWDDFCDWYIEIAKLIPNPKLLRNMYKLILKSIHPFVPFITEAIWQIMPENKNKSILLEPYPEEIVLLSIKINESADQVVLMQMIIKGIRNLKSEFNLVNPQGISIGIRSNDKEKLSIIENNLLSLTKLARVEMVFISKGDSVKGIQQELDSSFQIILPLNENINIEKEIEIKKKKQSKILEELNKLSKKLMTEDFINHAPEEIILETKQNFEELCKQKDSIEKRINELDLLMK